MMKGGLDDGMNDCVIRYCRDKCVVQESFRWERCRTACSKAGACQSAEETRLLINGVHLCWHTRGLNWWLDASPQEKKKLNKEWPHTVPLCASLSV